MRNSSAFAPGYASLFFLALLLAKGTAGATAAERPSEACEYLQFFVETADTQGSESPEVPNPADSTRREFLKIAIEILPEFNLRRTRKRSEASWVVSAAGFVGVTGAFNISITLDPALALKHHMYIALLNDSAFPFRGEIGGAYTISILPEENPEKLRDEFHDGMKWIWGRDAEQISALCEVSRKIKEEGWDGIQELQLELVREMKRVRKERAQAKKKKFLHLEVE
jgi:hypothetical protein